MQLRYQTGLTSSDYVSFEAWRDARLERCPLHRESRRCGFARHGTYERVHPPGTQIARWYCPQGHQTFSLLPDCLASRLSATLREVEQVVAAAEQAESVEAAANRLRTDPVFLPAAIRWTRRRIALVRPILTILIGLMPEHFFACQPTLASFRHQLGRDWVLETLRGLAAAHLSSLPPPLGFGPRLRRTQGRRDPFQQQAGPDPPGATP